MHILIILENGTQLLAAKLSTNFDFTLSIQFLFWSCYGQFLFNQSISLCNRAG